MPWLQISAVFQVLLSAFLVTLVLMHSGREAGMGGLGFTPHSQGGTHIVERNLTRLTVVVARLRRSTRPPVPPPLESSQTRALVAELVDALG